MLLTCNQFCFVAGGEVPQNLVRLAICKVAKQLNIPARPTQRMIFVHGHNKQRDEDAFCQLVCDELTHAIKRKVVRYA